MEQVCRKAGLPTDAWQDEDTALMTFQGHAIEGEVKTLLADSARRAPPKMVAEEGAEKADGLAAAKVLGASTMRRGPGRTDVAMLADICRQNLDAMMIGATPTYYAPGAFDGGVQAVVLSLQLPGRADRIDCSQVNILGGMPLQSTLFELSKAAADLLRRSGVRPAVLSTAVIGLTVLWDAAMHGSPEAP
ncbi:MAG: hypothetical protein ABSG53_24490, partial [Thermoguttaceae bacterium]